jgi:hypothetical protein
MRIYYFGELIEIDGQRVVKCLSRSETGVSATGETKIAKSSSEAQTSAAREQTALNFDADPSDEEPKKTGMPSLGDILKEIDLNLDVSWPFQKVLQ